MWGQPDFQMTSTYDGFPEWMGRERRKKEGGREEKEEHLVQVLLYEAHALEGLCPPQGKGQMNFPL